MMRRIMLQHQVCVILHSLYHHAIIVKPDVLPIPDLAPGQAGDLDTLAGGEF
jgi:hypothetical protein